MKHRIPIVLASMAFLGLYSANVSALPEGAIARLGDGAVVGTDRAIAFSPDGGTLALATAIGIRLYETATLQEAGFIETEVRVYSAAFSPDGSLLAV